MPLGRRPGVHHEACSVLPFSLFSGFKVLPREAGGRRIPVPLLSTVPEDSAPHGGRILGLRSEFGSGSFSALIVSSVIIVHETPDLVVGVGACICWDRQERQGRTQEPYLHHLMSPSGKVERQSD